jgi:hypothetical protein
MEENTTDPQPAAPTPDPAPPALEGPPAAVPVPLSSPSREELREFALSFDDVQLPPHLAEVFAPFAECAKRTFDRLHETKRPESLQHALINIFTASKHALAAAGADEN